MGITPIRRLWICLPVTFVLAAAGAAHARGLTPPVPASSTYLVQHDLRMCPAPLCGGFWVTLVNRDRTRCHDGISRPRCYIAVILDARTQRPSTIARAENALVRGVIGTTRMFEGSGELGAITITQTWNPVGGAPPRGRFYRVRDTGMRCIRAPCFSFRLSQLNTPAHATVSKLDLGPGRSDPATLKKATAALVSPAGLLASGRIVRTANGGRLFRASQVFLIASTPPA